ncbi:cytochrome c biogenesis protein ResB, partial [Salmonella enterica]|nr:cytochrome c biogenesis protein ResB [Salmonella enterica]
LPPSNPSWRGNMFLPEGSASDVVLLSWRDGSLVQTLPFRVELKQFRIEFYNTGMPKLFASEVDIIDKATGARESASIKVNEPLIRD